MIDARHGWNVSFKPIYLGFILSLILVAAAYRIVTYYHLSHWALVLTIFALGLAQAIIQLVFFLHLGLGAKPHWNLISFFFMVLVVVVVVGGSLWIMWNLSYNLMPSGGKYN